MGAEVADIRHRVGISAPQERVFAALSTKGELANWWTRDVEGEATPGSTLRFFFGTPDPGGVMEVVDTTPNHRVTWRCVAGSRRLGRNESQFRAEATGD
jgi:uncharacterized protein YndB with AHSA1/START domain